MIASLILVSQLLVSVPGAPDRYELDFRDTAMASVRVDARVLIGDGTLHVEPYTSQQPDFWRSRIHDMRVSDSAGRPLAVDSLGALRYRIGDGQYRGPATLAYRVDYAFARHSFPSGNQKGGLQEEGALYLVTKPLFVTPNTGDAEGARRVRLHLPAAWKQATPWRTEGDWLSAGNRRDLVRNTLVVGRFAAVAVRSGGFEATAAFVGAIAGDSAMLTPVFTTVVAQYLRMFPGTPAGHYLMTFFYADHDDGEAFASSSTVTFGNRIAGGTGDDILFNNKIAHEVLHYWIGQRIRGEDHDRMSWMTEGFTEYIANRTIFQTGLITRREYLEKLGRHIGAYSYYWYSPLFEGRTVFAGSTDKTRNRFGVYDGGAVAALCLDLTILEATGGRRRLDDVLLVLWERYAKANRGITMDDLSAVLVEVGGETLRPFLPRYVTGHALLPFERALSAAGVRSRTWPLSAESYLTDMVESSRASVGRAVTLAPRGGGNRR